MEKEMEKNFNAEKAFCKAFKSFVDEHGYSLDWIGDKIDVHPTTVAGWYYGNNAAMSNSIPALKAIGFQLDGVVPKGEFTPALVKQFIKDNKLTFREFIILSGVNAGTFGAWMSGRKAIYLRNYSKLVSFVENYGDKNIEVEKIEVTPVAEPMVEEIKVSDFNKQEPIVTAEPVDVVEKIVVAKVNNAIAMLNDMGKPKTITFKELYAWAERHNALDAEVLVGGSVVNDYRLSIGKDDNAIIDLQVGA